MKKRTLAVAFATALILRGAVGTTQAPARAILLVTNRAAPNALGSFVAEIMKTEGLPAFNTLDVSQLDSRSVKGASLVVLAETPLTASQASTIKEYLSAGGRLVAMRPDAQLHEALGVSDAGADGSERYLSIDSTMPSGSGLPGITLPITGPARHYRLLQGSTALGTLYADASTATAFPAVVRAGRAVTWAYDLARSVVYARQGDPANAGQDRDNSPPIRTADLFYRAIDLDRVQVPHADIQMRLFSRVVSDLLADAYPLARLWYFPNSARTLLVATADSHIHDARAVRDQLDSVEARGGRLTMYVSRYVPHPTAAEANTWRQAGHEFGLHPYGAQDEVSLEAGFRAAMSWFNGQGPSKPSRTTRTHQIEWTSWVGPAQLEARHNIAMDTSFYTWGPAVTYADGHQAHGFITGSGLPMRFVDQAGAMIPVYQQVTSIIDEQLSVGDFSEHLPPPDALAIARRLIDDSLGGGYSALVAQFHTDTFGWAEVRPWAEATLDYARDLGIPIWTAEHWLNYTEARAAAEITGLSWKPPAVSFSVSVPARSEPLTLVLPAIYGERGAASLTVDGRDVALVAYAIAGRPTLFFTVPAGVHEVVARYTADAPPPLAPAPAASAPALSGSKPGAAATPQPPAAGAPPPSSATAEAEGPPPRVPAFTDCGEFDGTMLVSAGDGELRLAGGWAEDFKGPSLDLARWAFGTWSGGTYRPVPADGMLSVGGPNGAWVRSARPLKATTLQATARFSAATWEHVGWGAPDFAGPFAIFSTANTFNTLTARTSLDGKSEERTGIGPIPEGFHVYRIERAAQSATNDVVRYFIDGIQKAEHSVATLPALHVYVSHNATGSSPPLDVRRLAVFPPYVARGTYVSCPVDAGAGNAWAELRMAANVPAGTSVGVRTRTSGDGKTWSEWSEAIVGGSGAISSPPGRFLEYRLELEAGSAPTSPAIQAVRTTTRPMAQGR